MTEEATKEGEGTETQAETKTQEEQTEKVYTQADLDAITAKVKAGLTSKLTKAEQQLEEARTKAMSDEEKKLEAARAEGRTEAEARAAAAERKADVKIELIGAGVPKDQAESVYRMVDPEADPAEAVAALRTSFPGLFGNTSTATAAAGGRNVSPIDTEYSEQYCAEQIKKHGAAWLNPERRAKLTAWRLNNRSSGLTRIG